MGNEILVAASNVLEQQFTRAALILSQEVWAAVSSHTALLSGEHESSRGQLFVFVTVFTDVVPTLLIRLQLGVFGKVVSQVVSTLISSVSRIPHATTMNARISIV